MRTLRSVERLISNATDVESIVRTMKAIAAVSIRRLEASVAALRPYDESVRRGLAMFLRSGDGVPDRGPRGEGHRVLAIVFGSDQGLCGSFNEDVAEVVHGELGESVSRADVLPVGRRVADRLEGLGWTLPAPLAVPGSEPGLSDLVARLLVRIESWRNGAPDGEVLVFHGHRRRGASSAPRTFRLLPLDLDELAEPSEEPPGRCLPYISMDRTELLAAIVRQYLFVSLYRACAESLAAESASRLAAMQSAERSIGERLAALRFDHQRLRQATITSELGDIVAGFEAQRGGRRESPTHTSRGADSSGIPNPS